VLTVKAPSVWFEGDIDQQKVPERYRLGEAFVPKGRYLDREFLELELERVFTRTWLMACRLAVVTGMLPMSPKAQRLLTHAIVAAQLAGFQISRALAAFFESCDVFLCPTLCSPPLRIGELNSMSNDLSHIVPILRRYMPGTSMFNISGQPAMSVPLAWNKAGLPLGMMFSARFGDEATLFRLAGQLEQARPWKNRLPPVCA
jgi:Asp-tRNA(Asn)/Glu-tRNA(Gln) amidotransferase A subunit family amidase